MQREETISQYGPKPDLGDYATASFDGCLLRRVSYCTPDITESVTVHLKSDNRLTPHTIILRPLAEDKNVYVSGILDIPLTTDVLRLRLPSDRLNGPTCIFAADDRDYNHVRDDHPTAPEPDDMEVTCSVTCIGSSVRGAAVTAFIASPTS